MYDFHSQVLGTLQLNGQANTVIARLHAKAMLYHMKKMYQATVGSTVSATKQFQPLKAEWCECTPADYCEHTPDAADIWEAEFEEVPNAARN